MAKDIRDISQLVHTQSQPSVQTDNAILKNNWLQHHAEQAIESRVRSKEIYAINVDFIQQHHIVCKAMPARFALHCSLAQL